MEEINFEKLKNLVKEEKKDIDEKGSCQHQNLILQGMNSICEDCGMIVSKNFSYEREWRYYGSNDTRHNTDPNRCNLRKVDDKGIFKDIEKYQINPKIINTANDIYETVTNNKIYRGNTRKGIIFACVYHAYNINNTPQSCKNLIQILDMEQKIALKGLKFVNLNLPLKSSIRSDNSSNEVHHLIQEIMSQFNASDTQINEVTQLYSHLMNRSSLLNRSRPQSVAYGLVCYYIMKKNPDYSLEYFKEKIKLSELTLSRIVREIETIIS